MMLFINKRLFYCCNFKIKFYMKILIFNKGRKTKAKNGLHSVIYLLYNRNIYRFCISVIGYINVQIIGIGYKKSISVDH